MSRPHRTGGRGGVIIASPTGSERSITGKVRGYALLLLAAFAAFVVLESLLELLASGTIAPANLVRHLVAWALFAPLLAFLYLRFTGRAVAPFTELLARTREVARDPSRRADEIPTGGWGELGELGAAIRELAASRESGQRPVDAVMAAIARGPIGVLQVDLEGRILFANAATVEILGWSDRDQVIGRRVDELSPGLLGLEGAVQGSLLAGETVVGRHTFERRGGQASIEYSIVPIVDERGTQLVALITDTTAATQRDLILKALDESPLALVISEWQGSRILVANEAWRALMGIAPGEPIVGRRLWDFDTVSTRAVSGEVGKLSEGGSWSGSTEIHRPDGSVVLAEGVIVRLHDEGDRVVEFWIDRSAALERDALFGALAASPLAVAIVDESRHRLIDANEAWSRLVGLPASAVLPGLDLDELDLENTARISEELAAATRRGERSWSGLAAITRPDGSRVDGEGWIVGLDPGEQPFRRTISFWIDRSAATERDAILGALGESSIGVVRTDADRTIRSVNEAWCAMTRLRAEEMVGRHPEEFDRDGVRRIAEARAAAPRRGIPWTGSTVITRPDGSELPVEGRIVDLPDGGSVSFWIDRSAELERDHIMTALEAAPVGFIVIDEASDVILSVNRAWAEMTGFTDRAQVIGRTALEIDPGVGPQMGDFREQRAKGIPWHGRVLMRRADGTSFPAEGYSISTRLPGGAPSRSVNFWIDRSADLASDRLNEALRLIPLGAAELDGTGRILWSNEAWRSLAGWSLVDAVVDPSILDGPGGDMRIDEALAAGLPWEGEIEIMRPRGGRTPVLLTVMPSSLSDERRSIAFLADRSEPVAREHELATMRLEVERLASALAATGLVIVMRTSLPPESRIEWVNRAFEKLTGRYAEAIVGKREDEIDAEYVRDVVRARKALATPDAPLIGDSSIARADGTRLPLRYELISLPVQGATYTFALDRSVELALEARLARLARSEGALDETRAALAAIEAQASLALGGEIDRELRADLEAIAESARRAAALLA